MARAVCAAAASAAESVQPLSGSGVSNCARGRANELWPARDSETFAACQPAAAGFAITPAPPASSDAAISCRRLRPIPRSAAIGNGARNFLGQLRLAHFHSFSRRNNCRCLPQTSRDSARASFRRISETGESMEERAENSRVTTAFFGH